MLYLVLFSLYLIPSCRILWHFLTIKSREHLSIEARNYSLHLSPDKPKVFPLEMVNRLPGDAPLVARISLPEDRFQSILTNGVDTALKFLSGNNLGADTDLPGFDLSARELLKFPSGDFVFAGGNSRTQQISLPNGQSISQSTPIWAGAMKIAQPLAFRELLAGMNSGMGSPHCWMPIN